MSKLDEILDDIEITSYDEGEWGVETYIESSDLAKSKEKIKQLFLELVESCTATLTIDPDSPKRLAVFSSEELRNKIKEL